MAVTQYHTPVVKFAAEGDALSDVLTNSAIDTSYFAWVSKGANAGDDLLVSDADGNTIIEDVADGAYFSKIYVIKAQFNDIVITTLDSGTFYAIRKPPDRWTA